MSAPARRGVSSAVVVAWRRIAPATRVALPARIAPALFWTHVSDLHRLGRRVSLPSCGGPTVTVPVLAQASTTRRHAIVTTCRCARRGRPDVLVDDLFALSRIHAGALRLTLEQVALADVISDAVAGATFDHGRQGRPAGRRADPVPDHSCRRARAGRVLLERAVQRGSGTPRTARQSASQAAWTARWPGAPSPTAAADICRSHLPRVFESSFRGVAARTPLNDAEHRAGLAWPSPAVSWRRTPVRSPLPTSPAAVGSSSGCR